MCEDKDVETYEGGNPLLTGNIPFYVGKKVGRSTQTT